MQTKTLQEINRRAVWLSSLAALIAIGPWIAAGPWIWPSIKEPSESWLSIALLTSPLWLMWLFAWVGWWLLAMYWVMQFRFLEPHRVLFIWRTSMQFNNIAFYGGCIALVVLILFRQFFVYIPLIGALGIAFIMRNHSADALKLLQQTENPTEPS
jgi:hypothetical protein